MITQNEWESMGDRVKRYYVVVRGHVQDVGYRKRVEGTAELLNIKGFPWNDVDGSVRIVCEGREDYLNRFLKDIEIKEELPSGIFVESLEKKEIPIEFPLPEKFARLEAEELGEISRKLDAGNERLRGIEDVARGIESNTGRLLVNTAELSVNTKELLVNNRELLVNNRELLSSSQRTEASSQRIEASSQRIEASSQGTEINMGMMIEVLRGIDSKLGSLPEKIAKLIK